MHWYDAPGIDGNIVERGAHYPVTKSITGYSPMLRRPNVGQGNEISAVVASGVAKLHVLAAEPHATPDDLETKFESQLRSIVGSNSTFFHYAHCDASTSVVQSSALAPPLAPPPLPPSPPPEPQIH